MQNGLVCSGLPGGSGQYRIGTRFVASLSGGTAAAYSAPQHIIQSYLKRLRSKTDNLRCKFDTLSARQKHSASIGIYFAQICFSKKRLCYFKRFRRARYIFVTIISIIKKPVHLTAPAFSSFGRKRGQSGSLWIIYSRFFCKRMYN